MNKQRYIGETMNAGAMEALHAIPADQAFALINLLLYNEEAIYPEGTETEKLTGQQAYQKYSEGCVPFINEVGGVPMWRGEFGVNLIGPEDEAWDEIVIMQYPSREAFESMIANPGYQAILHHRTAAVKDSRLYGAVSPQAIGPMKWALFNLSQRILG